MKRIHVILPLALMAIGLVLMFDALSSHALEWPLGLFVLFTGTIWLLAALVGGSCGRTNSFTGTTFAATARAIRKPFFCTAGTPPACRSGLSGSHDLENPRPQRHTHAGGAVSFHIE